MSISDEYFTTLLKALDEVELSREESFLCKLRNAVYWAAVGDETFGKLNNSVILSITDVVITNIDLDNIKIGSHISHSQMTSLVKKSAEYICKRAKMMYDEMGGNNDSKILLSFHLSAKNFGYHV